MTLSLTAAPLGYDCDCQNNPESELAVHYERIVNVRTDSPVSARRLELTECQLQNGPNLAKMLLICALPYGEKLFSVFKHIPIASISGPIGSLDDAMKHVKRVARRELFPLSSFRS